MLKKNDSVPGFVVNTPSFQCLQAEWSDWVLSSIALNCPCSHTIGKTELLLLILFILFTSDFVTKQLLPLKPLNVAQCARFGGITWRKQSSWLDDSPAPVIITVFNWLEILLAHATPGTKKNAKCLDGCGKFQPAQMNSVEFHIYVHMQ